ncbi:MAG: class I SAM-dependent methyltransferase [Nitrospirae bacterium]|nr:MAG: class I SAM-dependent methyltransferase [Nitrospirota bacterium]
MAEVNLLDRYPRVKRPVEERGQCITEQHRGVARHFGKEYFDGDRLTGYGGYRYHPKFWQATVRRFAEFYDLAEDCSVLDVGCAKGFMLYDFQAFLPQATFAGIDISPYAIAHSPASIRPFLCVGNAKALPFPDRSFDLVISINTVHNLPIEECKRALQEIQRVSKHHAFVTMDAWRNDREREQLMKWNLTALTYLHVEEWIALFNEIGYGGDYYWFLVD